jgi:hypothetical protein
MHQSWLPSNDISLLLSETPTTLEKLPGKSKYIDKETEGRAMGRM